MPSQPVVDAQSSRAAWREARGGAFAARGSAVMEMEAAGPKIAVPAILYWLAEPRSAA